MTQTFATRALAAALAVAATLATVTGVDHVAQREYVDAQTLAAANADARVASIQHVTIVGHRASV